MSTTDLVFFGGLVCLSPFILISALAYGRVMRIFRDRHREEWLNAGSPPGALWLPSDVDKPPANYISLGRHRFSWIWLISTPEWATGEPDTLYHLKRFRISSAVAAVGTIALLVVIVCGPFSR